MTRRVSLICAVLWSFPALPQTLTSIENSGSAPGPHIVKMSFRPGQYPQPVITGQPYSAERHSERVQTLADGTHINNESPVQKIFRDSQGRTRSERAVIAGPGRQPGTIVIEITDPVAGLEYVLDPEKKIAHRSHVSFHDMDRPHTANVPPTVAPVSAAPAVAAANAPDSNRPQTTFEKLDPQIIEGLSVEGRRNVTTIPTGAQGNDRPLVSTYESWYSADLKVPVLSKSTDPRMGESTSRLTNISRVEPDPALFAPPSDYQVVDESGEFTITFTRQQ